MQLLGGKSWSLRRNWSYIKRECIDFQFGKAVKQLGQYNALLLNSEINGGRKRKATTIENWTKAEIKIAVFIQEETLLCWNLLRPLVIMWMSPSIVQRPTDWGKLCVNRDQATEDGHSLWVRQHPCSEYRKPTKEPVASEISWRKSGRGDDGKVSLSGDSDWNILYRVPHWVGTFLRDILIPIPSSMLMKFSEWVAAVHAVHDERKLFFSPFKTTFFPLLKKYHTGEDCLFDVLH